MVIMIILSSLGVHIGPLLAGAGVVGIAIGFGAQTLVRDIVSGVFFLLDDAFRVGEYIDLGSVKGTVEKISIRSMQLRHHRGALNTVPFGEIQYLTNYSRDWAIMKLQFRVTYDTDVNQVKKIFKQINTELMENEEIAANLLEPLKSQGVLSMEDSAMIIRAKFTAKPGEQFVIRREVYTRVQKAFEEAGIKFAHREVTVHVPEAANIDRDKVGQVAGAAARRMVEDDEAAAAAGPAKASA
jgi:small-conductance mechanosensitive channel